MSQGSAFTTLPPFRLDAPPSAYLANQTAVHQPYNFAAPTTAPSVTAHAHPLPLNQLSNMTPALAGPSNIPSYPYRAPDPQFIPLPPTSDADLFHGPTIAAATGHSAVPKVAGSRRSVRSPVASPCRPSQSKGKAKRKRDDLSDLENLSDASELPVKQHGGRRAGAGNYGDAELHQLLSLVESVLPFGQTGWHRVHTRYIVWATKNNKPIRDAKALENKFKTLVRMKKPTGTGKRPACVTRAKAIDKLINDKLATRSINDDDAEDNDPAQLSGDDDPPEEDAVHAIVVRSDRSAVQQRRHGRNLQSTELAQKLSAALDPETQRLRDEERAARSLQNTQVFTISQQLRDSNSANEDLRREIARLRDRLDKMSRQRDRLDLELNMERRMSSLAAQAQGKPRRPGHKYDPDLTRMRGKIRNDEYFPDGGQSTTWITDGSSSSDWEQNKENISPHSARFHPYSRSAEFNWSPHAPIAPHAFRSPIPGLRSNIGSPDHFNFHSPKQSTNYSPNWSRKGYRPSSSQNFPGPQRCMKPPIILPPILPPPSPVMQPMLKPQQRKFSNVNHNSPLLATASSEVPVASVPSPTL